MGSTHRRPDIQFLANSQILFCQQQVDLGALSHMKDTEHMPDPALGLCNLGKLTESWAIAVLTQSH